LKLEFFLLLLNIYVLDRKNIFLKKQDQIAGLNEEESQSKNI